MLNVDLHMLDSVTGIEVMMGEEPQASDIG